MNNSVVFEKKIKNQTIWVIWQPFLIGMGMVALGPVLPEIRSEIGFSASAMGITLFLASFAGILVSSIAGSYSDRFGKVRITKFALLVASSGAFLIVISRQGWLFTSGYVLFFAGISTMAALVKGILADIYPQTRTSSLTYSAIFWNSGSVIACLIIALFLFIQVGWRAIFMLLFLLYLLMDVVISKSSTISPKENIKNNPNSRPRLHINPLILNILATMFFLESAITFQTWLTTYLTASGKTNPVLNALTMSAFWLLFLMGVIFKRFLLKYFDELGIIFGSALIILASLVIFYLSPLLLTKITSSLIVAFMYASTPVLLTAVAIDLFPAISGAIAGILQSTMILGSVITQPLQGIVMDRYGVEQGLFLPIISIFLALISVLLLRYRYINLLPVSKETVNESQ